MLNLMKYYKENVLATDYYYKFYDCIIDFSNTIINDDLEVLESNISQFDFFDDDDELKSSGHVFIKILIVILLIAIIAGALYIIFNVLQ